MRAFAVAVLGIFCSGLNLWAGDAEAPKSEPAAGMAKDPPGDPEPEASAAKLQRGITFEFSETPLGEAIAYFRAITTLPLILEPELERTAVSLKVQNIPIREAMAKLLEAAKTDAKVSFVDGVYWIGKHPPRPTKDLLPKPRAIPELGEADRERARAAIKNLSADDYEERAGAQTALRKLGIGVLPLLRETQASGDTDAERRAQVSALASDLEVLVACGPLDPACAAMLERPVSFEFAETPLSDAAAFFDSLTSQKVRIQSNVKAQAQPVTLRVEAVEMAAALRWVARLTHTSLSYSEAGVSFIPKPDAPSAPSAPAPTEPVAPEEK